jgi:hypothetical protein
MIAVRPGPGELSVVRFTQHDVSQAGAVVRELKATRDALLSTAL